MTAAKHCPAERVREQIVSVLTSWGMGRDIVETTAEVMVETDLAGVDSHGVSMLMDDENSKSKGKLNVRARPHIVKETPVMALIDAFEAENGGRAAGNTVRSFLIHNGVALSAAPLR